MINVSKVLRVFINGNGIAAKEIILYAMYIFSRAIYNGIKQRVVY